MPVLVRNADGEIRAFRNVCAHRGSLLALPGSAIRSNSGAAITAGSMTPREGSFGCPTPRHSRGIRLPEHHLAAFRVERFGPFVFVNLSSGVNTVRDFFGPLLPDIERFFLHHRLTWVKATQHAVNWKIIRENAIESYHVPMIHPRPSKISALRIFTTIGSSPDSRATSTCCPGAARFSAVA